MTPPRIALTTSAMESAGSYQQPSVFLYESYITVLETVGLAPLLVTPAHSTATVRATLEICDGLVLSGGEDVDPARYGESPSPALGSVSRRRDEVEFCAMQAALTRQIPILGICRGAQLINVVLGGTLYQDLATEMSGGLMHHQSEPWGKRSHHARVVEGSRLREIAGAQDLFINSYHHQAIRDVARELEVVARADDGMVEAVEGRDHPWLIGVQWHPERYEASTPSTDPDRRLFDAFADAVYRHTQAPLPADLSAGR
jgi:putative glutamine amidotransferase